jgi:hypothetical protein
MGANSRPSCADNNFIGSMAPHWMLPERLEVPLEARLLFRLKRGQFRLLVGASAHAPFPT